jgi:hypothetical protein
MPAAEAAANAQTLATMPPDAAGNASVSGLCAVAETRVGIIQYFPDDRVVGASVAWYGEYLQQQLDLVNRFLRRGAIVVEIAPGIGLHAISLASSVGPDGHLFLYESRAPMRHVLQHNLQANGVSNFTIMRRAIGACESERTPLDSDASVREPFERTETIDELRLARLDWLKIDEHVDPIGIVDGAAATLWRLRPFILASVGGEIVLNDAAQRLRDFGYRSWRFETPLFNSHNFNRRVDNVFDDRTAKAILGLPEEVHFDAALDGCREIR